MPSEPQRIPEPEDLLDTLAKGQAALIRGQPRAKSRASAPSHSKPPTAAGKKKGVGKEHVIADVGSQDSASDLGGDSDLEVLKPIDAEDDREDPKASLKKRKGSAASSSKAKSQRKPINQPPGAAGWKKCQRKTRTSISSRRDGFQKMRPQAFEFSA